MTLRVTHAPVNVAGIPWANVEALRRRGVDARLVVFNRSPLHPEADWSLERRGGLPRRLATQFAALARLVPQTDVFHFYFGLGLVPNSVQFRILRATRRKGVLHFLGTDIRGKTPEELAYANRADARIVGSVPARRFVPDAHVIPPGLELARFTPVPPSDNPRPLVVHAPSNREKKGTRHVIDACAQLPVDLEIVEGMPHTEARERYLRADIVVDQFRSGWYGMFAMESMALGKPVVARLDEEMVERSAEELGARVPIMSATPDRLADVLRPLVESPELRREVGAAGRAYVEAVHDVDVIADRLVALYRSL